MKWTGKLERPVRHVVEPRIYDDTYLQFKKILEAVKRYSPQITGKVLDVGAGKCNYRRFYKNADKYVTLDPFEYPNIDIVADAAKMPIKANSYDSVVCIQVLEHVPDPTAVVKEIHRVLKKGGKVFLSTHMAAPLHGEPYDFYRFTKYQLKNIFSDFKNVRIREQGGGLLSITQLIVWGIDDMLPGVLSKPIVSVMNFCAEKLDPIVYNPLFTLNYDVFAEK